MTDRQVATEEREIQWIGVTDLNAVFLESGTNQRPSLIDYNSGHESRASSQTKQTEGKTEGEARVAFHTGVVIARRTASNGRVDPTLCVVCGNVCMWLRYMQLDRRKSRVVFAVALAFFRHLRFSPFLLTLMRLIRNFISRKKTCLR